MRDYDKLLALDALVEVGLLRDFGVSISSSIMLLMLLIFLIYFFRYFVTFLNAVLLRNMTTVKI